MTKLFLALASSKVIQFVVWAVVVDTFFGVGRAIKQHKFNSSFGIDGAIRKIAMVASICFVAVLDCILGINLIAIIPAEVRSYFPESIAFIGLAEFFGLLYAAYEIVSILKNMYLCGLPVKWVWERVRKFLTKYTNELPDAEA